VNEGRGTRTTVVMAAILLALTFIWRLMPADEAPSSTLNALSILLELGMLVGVVGLVPRILRSLPEGAPRGGWIFLLGVAIVSGAGIFCIRLAGGPRVELPPRTSSNASSDSGLRHQVHEQIVALEKLSNKLAASRWIQTFATQDPVKIRTLTRQDLREQRALCAETRECADRILKVFADATAKGVAHSTLSDEPGATRPETWQATRETYIATYDYLGLIEQHWDEWLANPFPTGTSDLKPWQLEIQRLVDAAGASSRQAGALLKGAAPTSVSGTDTATLRKQLQELAFSYQPLVEKLGATRWFKSDEKRSLTRRDLQDGREAAREMCECLERILKIFAEAESKGIDLSTAFETPYLARPEFWQVARQSSSAGYEKLCVIDQNWDDWVAHPFSEAKSDLKPWQREVRRLEGVAAAAFEEMKALAAPVTPTPSSLRAPSPPGNNFDQVALQTHMLPAVGDYVIALKRVQATRWVKSPDANAYHPQKITRVDLHDANEKLRDLIATIDKLRTDLDAQNLPVPVAEKDYWQVKRETSIAFQRLTTLLEENWKEWHVSGIQPKTGEAKPWQKEALRLQAEIDKLKQNEQTSVLL
jgi:hypothetical protein